MASSSLSKLSNIQLPPALKHHRYALFIASAISIPVLLGLRRNYLEWIALGRGGPPANVFGWTMNWIMYLFSREQVNTALYDDPAVLGRSGELAKTRFIHGELPERKGVRPVVAPFIAPQRQYPIQVDEKIIKVRQVKHGVDSVIDLTNLL